MRLSAFEGQWRMAREIEDVRAGETGSLRGVARFEPSSGGVLLYSEGGALALGGRPAVQATRRYFWRDAGAAAIEVLFEDGRFFHRFYADEEQPGALHDCPPDRYRVRYDFSRWPTWRAEWRVTGPRKDYGMMTEYRPMATDRA